MSEQIKQWGCECAEAAIDAGGADPTDSDGRLILPQQPQDGDWIWLREQLGREPSADERGYFSAGYSREMARHADR